MDNYEFCAQWVSDQPGAAGASVLDYGCGGGEIVMKLRGRNIDAYGCDVFYDAGDFSPLFQSELFGTRVRKMEDGTIPFPDATFDLVVNNFVLEHVEDLNGVLREIHRVLKPGGKLLTLVPDRGVWREGHCGIPFIHWFARGSRARLYYAVALRMFGLGYHKRGHPGILQWSRYFCDWIDKWTHYRPRKEIVRAFNRYFARIDPIEDYWLDKRLSPRRIARIVPTIVKRIAVGKLAGMVFVSTKASTDVRSARMPMSAGTSRPGTAN